MTVGEAMFWAGASAFCVGSIGLIAAAAPFIGLCGMFAGVGLMIVSAADGP